MKAKFKFGIAMLTVAASTVAGCNLFKKNTVDADAVQFWSSFGGAYTTVLNGVVAKITEEKGIKIEHASQGSYDEINRNMISAIAVGDYPNIAMGYPDHFATYLSSGILNPLDGYLSEADLADYYAEYMHENYFYDDGGENAQKKLYALPFNKSTELLGYNGVFVDYCASLNPVLADIPATWQDWEVKAPLYNAIFKSLMGKILYGKQDIEGTASEFELLGASDAAPAGKAALLDMSKVDPGMCVLMSWDATDNAFITLTRQWGAQYTNLPESEKTKVPKKRVGEVLFNSSENQPKVIEMLKFLNKWQKDRIFDIPTALGGQYASSAFEQCKVMFMVCSSGGLSYNTAIWNHRFRSAPVPYYAGANGTNKYVISQGANICLTNRGNFENSVATIKALTTGKYQTEWCLETGYYPCSKSALESAEYQAFLHEADDNVATTEALKKAAYSSPTRVAYREGSELNANEYMDATKGWNKFVDAAFKGSSDIRTAVKSVFGSVFALPITATDADYAAKLNAIENDSNIKGQSTIKFVH